LGVFFLPPVSGSSRAGIFFLKEISMNLVWVFGLCAIAMVLQNSKQAKGPSTSPATAGSARDDKNNNKSVAPRLAALARGDKSKPRAGSSPSARKDKSKEAQAGKPVPQQAMAADRVQHTYVQTIHAPADRVFAVIEPVAEVAWAPGFEYQWVYARDGAQAKAGQEGDVFVTQHHSGLGSQGTAVWVISRRDFKERRIQFVRVSPDYQVTQIDVHVVANGKRSKCEVTYTYTALSERGREGLKQITREHYEAQMKEWEEQVNDFLGDR
jgi:hypothetical protein